MKSLRDEKCRDRLIERINNLSPSAQPVWGRMNVGQMLSHLVHAGELPFVASAPDGSTFISRRVIKPLALYLLTMPKDIKTSPEIDQQQRGRPPVGFEEDRQTLIESIHEVGAMPEDQAYHPHPFFGKLSAREWALIGHKHIDHHLRQFGA